MTLENLLKQITPLPWPKDGFDFSQTSTYENSTAAEMSGIDYDYARHAANLFPELVKTLEQSIEAMRAYIPKSAKGYKEGCFKYVFGGSDMWNCDCPICKARSALTRAKEIKIC